MNFFSLSLAITARVRAIAYAHCFDKLKPCIRGRKSDSGDAFVFADGEFQSVMAISKDLRKVTFPFPGLAEPLAVDTVDNSGLKAPKTR